MAAKPTVEDLAQYTAAIDHVCSVTLKGGEKFESVVWATSSESRIVVFRQSPVHTFMKADYIAVNANEIASFVVKGPSNAPLPSIRELTAKDAEKSIKDAMAKLELRMKTRGKGVSAEAQAIFDSLEKILTGNTWRDDVIVLPGSRFILRPPYGESDLFMIEGLDKEDKDAETFRRYKSMVSSESIASPLSPQSVLLA